MAGGGGVVPHGLMELSDPQGVGLENEREADSSALGWQLSPKQQETDVPLTPPPPPFPSLTFSSSVHLIIDPASLAQLGMLRSLSHCIWLHIYF